MKIVALNDSEDEMGRRESGNAETAVDAGRRGHATSTIITPFPLE
jgi:hypothetical protein